MDKWKRANPKRCHSITLEAPKAGGSFRHSRMEFCQPNQSAPLAPQNDSPPPNWCIDIIIDCRSIDIVKWSVNWLHHNSASMRNGMEGCSSVCFTVRRRLPPLWVASSPRRPVSASMAPPILQHLTFRAFPSLPSLSVSPLLRC